MRKEMVKIQELISKKNGAIAKEESRRDVLAHKKQMIEAELAGLEISIAQKEEERDRLSGCFVGIQGLDKKSAEILEYLQGLSEKFEAIEWRPDMPDEEKITGSDYRIKADERYALEDRITELAKEANKIYWRV